MSASRLCTYHYDPLDRLTSEAVATHVPVQRFYCKSRLATEIEGAINRSIVQHDDQLLALTETQGNIRQATLVASDQQRSVLQALAANESQSFAYSPYGHRPTDGGLLSLLGFNGERPDPVTGHYLLGNGYRAFNPILMRFNSPDSWSPFKKGGMNLYAYCLGDPINRIDPNGAASIFSMISNFFRRVRSSTIAGVVHQRSGPSSVFHRSTQTTLSEVLIHKSKPIIAGTSNLQTIGIMQTKYPAGSNGKPDLRRFRTTITSMELITSTHPTLLETAYSKVTDFKSLQPILFDSRYSHINLHNRIEQAVTDKALQIQESLSNHTKNYIYNEVLLKAQAGGLQGIDPTSIAYLRPVKTVGEYSENRMQIIRGIG